LSRMSVPVKIEKGRHIVSCMSAIPSFKNSLPALSDVTVAIDDLEGALRQAMGGGPLQTAVMHEREAVLDNLLSQLVNYAEIVANGEESVLLAAGLQVKKKTPRPPRQFAAKTGHKEGEATLQTVRIRGAGYVWQKCCATDHTEIPASDWEQFAITTLSTVHISELSSGAKYWFRVATVTSAGQGPWSDPISLIIAR